MAHYGKYRGSVIDNVDPQQRGRVQVQVPDLPGDESLPGGEPLVQVHATPRVRAR